MSEAESQRPSDEELARLVVLQAKTIKRLTERVAGLEADRVEPASGLGQGGQQRRGLWALRPGQAPGAADVEEIHHDHTPTVDKLLGEVARCP